MFTGYLECYAGHISTTRVGSKEMHAEFWRSNFFERGHFEARVSCWRITLRRILGE
jgi:hypothetical protein